MKKKEAKDEAGADKAGGLGELKDLPPGLEVK